MGFVDLSITELAEGDDFPMETGLPLCDRLGTSYKKNQIRLALNTISNTNFCWNSFVGWCSAIPLIRLPRLSLHHENLNT